MRRDDHRHAARRELAHDVEHLGDELRVEGARDLVEEHEVRLHRQRPDDRDALLLAAREPVGVVRGLVLEAEAARAAPSPASSASARDAAEDLPRRQRDVVEDAQVREQVERLEDDADPAPDAVDVDARRGDVLAADLDPAGVDRLEQVDAAEQRGLAAARTRR